MNITDQDLTNGQYTLTGDANSNARVENHGTIHTLQGGTVALIAPNVRNTGSINTPNGTTHLTAASQVTLALQDGSLTQYQVDQGVLTGLVDNGGAIIANNGAVYLTAKAKGSLSKAVVNHSGIIEANRLTQNAKGEIVLLGDMQNGETNVSGILKAEGQNGQNGGFIETSAAKVKIDDRTQVSTISEGGKTGTWLIDPTDFTVAASGGDMTGLAVSNALAGNNFTIQSTQGAQGTQGDIHINDGISWNQNILTLDALKDIHINSAMNGSGTAGLALKYGQANVVAGNSSTYHVNAPVNLASTGSFSTQLGNDGAVKNYTIITALGAQGSTTPTDLQGINGNLTGNYVLGADIDASATSGWNSATGFDPLGNNTTQFSGVFDGLGHTISNLTINRPITDYVGLFGRTNGASIYNIGLLGGAVTGQSNVGGLVGYNSNSSINNAYATGAVTGQVNVGGLVGGNENSSISNAYATGEVTGSTYVGGLVGLNFGSINNAYAMGSVAGGVSVGGLVGINYSNISNAYATGEVTGFNSVGGLVGQSFGSISNAYAMGSVTGSTYAGGLVGLNNTNSSISNAYAMGAVTGQNFVGGLVGRNDNSSINNAYAMGLVTGQDFVGGLVGYSYNSPINNAYATELVTGQNFVGGLVGWNDNSSISNAYATGAVTGQNFVGGLLGLNYYGSSVSNAYATGTVTGNQYVGGLVGGNYTSISNAYATGAVIGTGSIVGGLVGYNLNSSDISNAYWNMETTGQLTSAGGGNGLTTAQMFDQANLTGLDFSTIWGNGDNQTTPYLKNLANNQVFNKNDLPIGVISTANRPALYTAILNVMQLQNINNNLSGKYVIGNHIDASDTVNWNSGAGFNPLGNSSTSFSGKFDGLGHTISNLMINRPTTIFVGLFGFTAGASISNIGLLGGAVTGQNYVGGLVGLSDSSSISNVYATGSVIGQNWVGDLVGQNYNSSISNAYATGTVAGQTFVGGLVGQNYNSSISNAYATGSVTSGDNDVGGLVGQNYNSSISNAYATGSVIGSNSVGGLVGYNYNSNINNAYATGSVTGNSIGGLVGGNQNGSINNVYATGSVTGQYSVGGLMGYNLFGSISNAYATGAVTGSDGVGGLMGYNIFGSISNAYATGAVTGSDGVGGLVGYNNNSSISNAYATGGVIGPSGVGGLVGLNQSGGTIANSYWNTETTGQTASAGGIGLTSAQMLFANSFVGFDIDDQGGTGKIWRIYEGQTNPLLRSFLTQATLNAQNQSLTYNGQTQGLNTSIFTGLDYNKLFSSQSSSKNVGTYNLSYYSNQQGYDLINNAANLTINKAAATVTANSLNTTYNGQNQTVSGFSAAGLVNGETAAVLSNVSASVTGKNAGSYSNVASGTDNNYELTFVDGSLDIGKAAATVTANSLNTTYNGQNQTVSGFTASGLVNGETAAVLSNVSASVTGKNAGSYSNVASGTDSNYDLTFVDGTLDIGKAAATVTANSLNTTYNGQNQTVSGFSASGLVNGETAAVLSNVSASVTGKNAGSYSNVASGTDSNYDLTFVDGTLDIGKAAATVTANSLNTTYNGQNQTVSGFSASGLVNGETAAVLSNVSASVTGKNAGSYSNVASGTDNNYELTFVDGSLDIDKAQATVTANSLSTTYNGEDQTVSGFTVSGLVNGETESDLSCVSAEVTGKNAGSYVNQASGTDRNYELTFIDGSLDIDKAQATVTANSLSTTYNGKDQTVSGFTASGLVNGETESVLSCVSASVTGKEVGSYSNIATGTDNNYELTFVDGSLDITKAKANIYMLTPNVYMQAIQFRRPHNLPTTTDIKTTDIQIIDGGVNLTGLKMLTGEH